MAPRGKKPRPTDMGGWTMVEWRRAGRVDKAQPTPAVGSAVAGPSSGGSADAGPSPAGGSAVASPSSDLPPLPRGSKGVTYNHTEHDPQKNLAWPVVQCKACPTKAKWHHMMSIKIVDVADKFKDKDKPEIDYFVYECHLCVAKRLKITEEEARTRIREDRPDITKMKRRAEKYKEGKALAAEFTMITSKKEKRVLTLDLMTDLFAPLAAAMMKKEAIMKLRESRLKEHAALLEDLRTSTSRDDVQNLLARLDAMEESLEEVDGPVAFRGRAADAVEHARYMQAALYKKTNICISAHIPQQYHAPLCTCYLWVLLARRHSTRTSGSR